MSVFTGGPYGRLAVMLNTLSSLNIEIIIIIIIITCPCNVYPLTPHFYIVKLGFTGVYIIFLFLLKNIDCGYPQSMISAKIRKLSFFLSKIFHFYYREKLLYIAWTCFRNVESSYSVLLLVSDPLLNCIYAIHAHVCYKYSFP